MVKNNIVYVKKDDIYKGIAENIETRFDISNYELQKPLIKRKNKKNIGLMKNKLDGNIMKRLARVRAKTYNYLIDNDREIKKAKVQKSV